jgi:hypothetical protein
MMASRMANGIRWLVRTVSAAGAATRSAFKVVDGSEHQVGAVEVEVFRLQRSWRIGLSSWAAFHVYIVSSFGGLGEGLRAVGRIKV